MESIIKIIGISLISVIIALIIKQYRPELAIYVSIITGCIILYMIIDKLGDIIELLKNISSKAGVNSQFLGILLKMTGVAILAEFAINICRDAGEGAIASKVEIGSKIIIISMSIPIISNLLNIIVELI